MDLRKVVADNLRALMQYAARTRRTEDGPASQKALAKATELGRGTIQRALGLDPSKTAVAIDTLAALAKAYDLHAWQLLIPDLDPTNPPVVAITDTEKLLAERLKFVTNELARRHDAALANPDPRVDGKAAAVGPRRARKAPTR
jgi:hypothetical protein